MSSTPRPPPDAQARPPPGAPGPKGQNGPASGTAPATPPNPAASVINNMHNLIAMDKEGKLKTAQIAQCRNLIVSHTRSIVLKNTLEKKQNPLLYLTPNLNVLLPFNGTPALITKEAFERNIQAAVQEGQRIRGLVIPLEELKAMLAWPAEERNAKIAKDQQLKERFATSVTWYTKGGADGFLPILGPPGHRPTNGANAAARPPAAGATATRPPAPAPPAAAPAAPAPTAPAQTRPTSSSDFKEEEDEPAAVPPPEVTVKSEPVETKDATNTNTAAEDSTAKPTPPPASGPGASGSLPGGTTIPPAAVLPPVPVEPEHIRRKRKLVEMLGEMAPGTEFELGVTDIFSEVLNSFIDEAARGAIKLAKHRNSEKVGVKDMAFFLDKTYGITIPGFNVQVPQKVHTGPEQRENKLDGRLDLRAEGKEGGKEGKEGRRKMVAPRAARIKAVEAEATEE